MNRTHTRDDPAWYRAVTDSIGGGIGAAAVTGWVMLTVLFAAGGSILVLTGTAALVHPQTLTFTVLAFGGVLGAVSASPILAADGVRQAASRLEAVLDSRAATESGDDGWAISSYESSGETYRRSTCCV